VMAHGHQPASGGSRAKPLRFTRPLVVLDPGLPRRQIGDNRMKSTVLLSRTLSGIAGEYFVAGELSRRGYVASLTLRNTRGIDILASNADATKSVGIQVKTNQSSKQDWLLTEAAEADTAENLFYVFIRLNRLGVPDYYVVPRAVVAQQVRLSHKEWLA